MATGATALAGSPDFPVWLSGRLQELDTDEAVFGVYIQGILEGDETAEEKSEALRGILAEIIENESEIVTTCDEIFEKWQSLGPQAAPTVSSLSTEEMDVKLVKLLESQSLAITKQKQYTEEEKKIREAILSQYSQMSDEDETGEEKAEGNVGTATSGLEKNLNAQTVALAEKVKREQARADCQKKKEKDKEDREKQKQLKEEKKEKRKTVKGERRR